MTTMIIGSFEKPGGGDALVDDLNTAEGLGGRTAIAHGAHLREEEIQLPGTLSFSYGIVGALLVGTVGTLIAWLVVWPMLGVSLPLGALGGFVAANALLGALAGSIAGAAEVRPGLGGFADRTEAASRTLVTAVVPNSAVPSTVKAFGRAGARGVTTA